MLIKDKIAIVTGATRGIGRAILSRFAEEGANVIGIYLSSDSDAATLREELTTRSLRVEFHKGSITDRVFVSEVMRKVQATFGRIDILVNNAGVVRDNFITQMSDEEWHAVFYTNFVGTYLCTTEVLPYMEAQGSGRVINVISVSGVLGREAQANYGASKGAIIGLTRLLARRYARKGIYFNTVAPGMIRTEMTEHIPKEKLSNFLRFTNMGCLGEPDQVANAVLYLSTPLSNYITDSVIKVDGGFLR